MLIENTVTSVKHHVESNNKPVGQSSGRPPEFLSTLLSRCSLSFCRFSLADCVFLLSRSKAQRGDNFTIRPRHQCNTALEGKPYLTSKFKACASVGSSKSYAQGPTAIDGSKEK